LAKALILSREKQTASSLVSIFSSVYDQTCFNRLTTHFNISEFGLQTMFDGVWSPNIARLSGPKNEQNIAHQTREQKKYFKFLIECLLAFKFYQTRPTTIKQHQTRWPNDKMFGHQTMFDGVCS